MEDSTYWAERYVEAVRALNAMKMFKINVQHSTVDVGWSQGSACGGYKELSAAISAVVSDRWNELRDEAVARAEAQVQLARKQLSNTLRSTDAK